MQKKKIAILAPYVGKINRGAESFVIEITKKLSKDFDVIVYSEYECNEISNNIQCICVKKSFMWKFHDLLYNKFSIYRKICWKFYYLIPDILYQKRFSIEVYKKLINEKYDLIYPNNGIWGARIANAYRKRTQTPYIYTGHGGVGQGEKLILQENPDKYICLTERHFKWASTYTNKVLLIPNGVDTNKFYNHVHNIGTKLVLSVGALTEFKHHEYTIDAMKNVPNARLLILGSGEQEHYLKKYANKELGSRCIIKSVPYSDMPKYYEEADLFVLPSDKGEAYGIVYLEAMASNLPIVAPDDSMRREIVKNAGLYCDVTNPIEYGNCIKRALEMEWGTTPLETVLQNDWKVISSKYKEIIDDLVNV